MKNQDGNETPLTRRRTVLASLSMLFLSGCSIFRSSERYQFEPIQYDGSAGSKVLRTAMTQYGAPYKYGRSSPNEGFDCSGLVYWAYRQHGIKLPRTTSGQLKAGTRVSAKNTRQGDIVVFRINRRRMHTGLVADRGRFLHSPSSGNYVRLEPLSDRYWKGKIISFRRIV